MCCDMRFVIITIMVYGRDKRQNMQKPTFYLKFGVWYKYRVPGTWVPRVLLLWSLLYWALPATPIGGTTSAENKVQGSKCSLHEGGP
jgi:hypothetical protein